MNRSKLSIIRPIATRRRPASAFVFARRRAKSGAGFGSNAMRSSPPRRPASPQARGQAGASSGYLAPSASTAGKQFIRHGDLAVQEC
jgi:hypothetical protein